MKDTIFAKEGFWVGTNDMLKYNYGPNARAVLDGEKLIMICEMTTIQEYKDNKAENECFILQEVFTTKDGNQFIYWSDAETGEDFITRIN